MVFRGSGRTQVTWLQSRSNCCVEPTCGVTWCLVNFLWLHYGWHPVPWIPSRRESHGLPDDRCPVAAALEQVPVAWLEIHCGCRWVRHGVLSHWSTCLAYCGDGLSSPSLRGKSSHWCGNLSLGSQSMHCVAWRASQLALCHMASLSIAHMAWPSRLTWLPLDEVMMAC